MRVHRVIQALKDAKPLTDVPNMIPNFVDLISKSAKFDLGVFGPDDNDSFMALKGTGHDILTNGLYAPPYPLTYIEMLTTIDGASVYTGVLSVSFKWLASMPDLPPEMVETLLIDPERTRHFLIIGNSPGDVESYGIGLFYFELSDEGVFTGSTINETPVDQDHFNIHATLVEVVLELSSALLTTRGAEVVHHPASEKLNRARLKKGGEPTYAHHTIKIGGVSTTGRVLGVGAAHASPRKHWRRGHVRTLHRGTDKEKRTLIPACLVNGRGFISKDYEVVA